MPKVFQNFNPPSTPLEEKLDQLPNTGNLSCGDGVLTNNGLVGLSGVYVGWSFPESVQWSNISAWDNRSWNVFFDSLDTDGLGAITTPMVTSTFGSFKDLIIELNSQLATYGSSFRLSGNPSGNRIVLTDLSGNHLLDGDSYFGTYQFGNMLLLIEDSATNSDWLVKALGPKSLTLTNTEFYGEGYSFKEYCLCDQLKSLPNDFSTPTDKIVAFKESIAVPSGFID